MKLFARISAAVCAAVAATACGGFDAGERRIINGGEGEIMRVLTTADRDDSLTLRRISAPLDEKAVASDDFAVLRRRMLATVRNPQNEGVGIAAPQVGVSRRLIAVQRFDKAGEPFEFYINPEILSVSGEAEEGPEGCLSVDGVRGSVARPRRIEPAIPHRTLRRHHRDGGGIHGRHIPARNGSSGRRSVHRPHGKSRKLSGNRFVIRIYVSTFALARFGRTMPINREFGENPKQCLLL